MKKIIAISVVFALVAGAAFAEVSISTGLTMGFNVLQGSDTKDSKIGTSLIDGGIQEFDVNFAGNNEDGTFSAFVKLRARTDLDHKSDANASMNHIMVHQAYAWWRPIEQFGIFMGRHTDGIFDTTGVVRWGFNQGGHGGVALAPWDRIFNRSFASPFLEAQTARQGYGGNDLALWSVDNVGFLPATNDIASSDSENPWRGPGPFGFALEVKPVSGLALRVGVPIYGGDFADVYKNIFAQGQYAIPDIGTVSVTYQNYGDTGSFTEGGGLLNAAFSTSSLVEGLTFELGFGYKFSGDADLFTIYDPVNIGGGVAYTGGDWGVKLRAAGWFGAEADTTAEGNAYFLADLMPWYNFGFMEARLQVRFESYTLNKDTDAVASIGINPYIMKQLGAGRFVAGFQLKDSNLDSDAKDDGSLSWSIPVAFVIGF